MSIENISKNQICDDQLGKISGGAGGDRCTITLQTNDVGTFSAATMTVNKGATVRGMNFESDRTTADLTDGISSVHFTGSASYTYGCPVFFFTDTMGTPIGSISDQNGSVAVNGDMIVYALGGGVV